MKQKKIKLAEVKITKKYFDIQENKKIQIGSVVVCTQERAKELVNAKVAEILCLKN